MAPLVSVVVPVFNGLPHLEDLVDSILDQTYPELEIVFSDGGSTDGSVDYLNSLTDPRVRVVTIPPGSGAAGNWTYASEQANGQFTKLICQDDLLYPTTIERQVADLQSHPTAVMATGQRDIIDASGRPIVKGRGLSGLSGDLIPGATVIKACYLQGTNVIGEPLAVLFRTEVLRACLPWQDDNPLMLDLSMYARVAPIGDVVVRREVVGAFRVSSTSWSTRLAKQQLDQTKRWQDEYEHSSTTPITSQQRIRAATGRHLQTNLRRIAYAGLRLRGRLNHDPATPSVASDPSPPRQAIGNVPYTVLPFDQAVHAILASIDLIGRRTDRPGVSVHFAPAYNVALARDDQQYAQTLQDADYVFSDGVPITWVGKRLRPDLAETWERVYGPDVMGAVFERSTKDQPLHYLLGSTPAVLTLLRDELQRRYPNASIVGAESPPFRDLSDRELLEQDTRVRESGATMVWVGLGTPRQDFEVRRLAANLPVVALAVGAAFDFIAGTKAQAPRWMQRSGLEWAFRFASEPWRLGRRYLWGNSVFAQQALRDLRSR